MTLIDLVISFFTSQNSCSLFFFAEKQETAFSSPVFLLYILQLWCNNCSNCYDVMCKQNWSHIYTFLAIPQDVSFLCATRIRDYVINWIGLDIINAYVTIHNTNINNKYNASDNCSRCLSHFWLDLHGLWRRSSRDVDETLYCMAPAC